METSSHPQWLLVHLPATLSHNPPRDGTREASVFPSVRGGDTVKGHCAVGTHLCAQGAEVSNPLSLSLLQLPYTAGASGLWWGLKADVSRRLGQSLAHREHGVSSAVPHCYCVFFV